MVTTYASTRVDEEKITHKESMLLGLSYFPHDFYKRVGRKKISVLLGVPPILEIC